MGEHLLTAASLGLIFYPGAPSCRFTSSLHTSLPHLTRATPAADIEKKKRHKLCVSGEASFETQTFFLCALSTTPLLRQERLVQDAWRRDGQRLQDGLLGRQDRR